MLPPNISPLFTIRETAAALRLHPISVYKLAASGALASVKIGHSVRVSAASIQKFLDSHTRTGPVTGEAPDSRK